MQKDLYSCRKARAAHFPDEVGDSNTHIPYASSDFDAVFPPCAKLKPFNGVELQPSPVCPKNYIILDQTYDRSQVMYHPEMTRKLSSPALNAFASSFQNEHAGECCNDYDQEASSSFKEDSDEIDALLSCDDDDEEYDAEEVSTARNYESSGNLSPESSFSSYGCSNSRKQENGGSGNASCNNGERKRRKMKKMMKVLRRIVPGGEQMNAVCILDEAVQYLKSLKVEAQKLGVGNFPGQA